MVVLGRTRDESEKTFVWLTQQITRHSEDTAIFDADAVVHLFTTKMASLDFASLTVAGFAMFETFFFHINEREKRLVLKDQDPASEVLSSGSNSAVTSNATSPTSTMTPISGSFLSIEQATNAGGAEDFALRLKKSYEVLSFSDLVGLEVLWQITLRAESETVAKLATSVLTSHQQPVATEEEVEDQEPRALVLTCVKNIRRMPALPPQ